MVNAAPIAAGTNRRLESKKMDLVLATKNLGKLKELLELKDDADWLNLQLAPDEFNPRETGQTFFENAKLKAVAASKLTGLPALADDSGLIVEALNGKPGIYSARYCEGSDIDRRRKLLADLSAVPDNKRHAAFMCAMVITHGDGSLAFSTLRAWEGVILREERGVSGFGYDPIFYLPKLARSAAELSPQEKNQLSHRGQAWRLVFEFLKQNPNLR